jgi:hypothetical protein
MVASQLHPPAEAQPVANGAAAASTGGDQFAPPHNIHVLLVDDERLSRVVVANLLRKCNYRGKLFVTGVCPLVCSWASSNAYSPTYSIQIHTVVK